MEREKRGKTRDKRKRKIKDLNAILEYRVKKKGIDQVIE